MSLDYQGLKDVIMSWALAGNEPTFNAQLPGFIQMAEARFNREIRAQNMIGVSTMTTSLAFPEVPPDWIETIHITDKSRIPGGSVPLKQLTINQQQMALYGVGTPWGYANTDGGFRLVPAPDGERIYEITYYRSLEPLSDLSPTNWLLFLHPDCYIYGALQYASDFLRNDEDEQKYVALTKDIIDNINARSKDQEFSRGQVLTRAISFG
jgi:hypothetical protein